MRVLLLGLIPLLTRAWVPRSNLPMAEKHRKSLTSKLPFALTSKVPFAFPITLSPAIRPMDYREIMTPKRSKQRGYIQRIALTALILVGLTQPVWASQVLSSGASAIHPTASASMGTAPLATPLMHRPTAGYALASPVSVWTELQLASRLVYSAVLGAAVGKERSVKNRRTAGIRTMALVSLGASLFTICSVYGFPAGDPSRMASNVASGVGFVGAGVITTTSSKHGDRKENFVHGLTTAAAIWLSAAVGVASGLGMYILACGAALSTIGVLRVGVVTETLQKKRMIRTKNIKSVDSKYIATPRRTHQVRVTEIPVESIDSNREAVVRGRNNETEISS